MRVPVAAALIAVGIAGISAASAADLPSIQSDRYSTRSYADGDRAGQLLIYDDQPGVPVRAYWLGPWRNRHYFPHTGRRPRIGRLENLSARGAWRPAESYYRYWSTSSAFLPEEPRASAQPLDRHPAPRVQRFQSAPRLVRPQNPLGPRENNEK
jgi:hypothetical protein